MMKSGLKRPVMSSTCAPISRPGAGTAKVRSSKPSVLARSSRIGSRLLAGRIVVVDVGDLLALEVAAQLLLGEGHRRTGLRPVAGRDREGVGVALAVGGRRRAEAGRRAEDLVLFQLLVQRRGLRRAVEAFEHRAFLLEALVRFDGRRHLVLVVDLEDLDLVALDAALAVHQGDVVLVAGAQHGARRSPSARCGRIAGRTRASFWAKAWPAPNARAAVVAASPSQLLPNLVMGSSLCSHAPPLIGEGPNPEIAPDIPPQSIEPLGLDDQKEDDQRRRTRPAAARR